jgi:putative transposase
VKANDVRSRVQIIPGNFSRVSPAIEVDYSLTGRRVVEGLERLSNSGLPQTIKVDNGTEFCSRAVDEWAERNGVKLDFSRPGKPIDNAYIETFNGRCREECLDQHWFASIERWRAEYNLERPHSGLDDRTPSEFIGQWKRAQIALRRAGFLTLETVQ